MLATLKAAGYPIAIVSNKIDSAVRGLADMFFPEIAVAIGEREGIPRKPAPDLVHLAMRELGAEDAYFIGDSEVDIATAQNAGLRCLSVTWGFRSEETLRAAGGEHFFATPSLLAEYLLGEAK
jgi:phosphoglycolate phosphatase